MNEAIRFVRQEEAAVMMFKLLIFCLFVVAVIAAALGILRLADTRADRALIGSLTGTPASEPQLFQASMVEGLPDPAARFFLFSIAPGTPLRTTALIDMAGELSLGRKDDPNHQSMQAHQVLSPPQGFIWQVRLAGPTMVTGSDAYGERQSWSRFRLLNIVPVGRASDDADHLRSSFGRLVGEGLFWTPAAFLPAAQAGWDSLEWEIVSEDTAAVTVRHNGLEQRAEVTVDETGEPFRVVFQRWSNENDDGEYRLQPFGGDLAEFEEFDGFRLPTRVTGGNFYGTDAYHPFFRASVSDIQFP